MLAYVWMQRTAPVNWIVRNIVKPKMVPEKEQADLQSGLILKIITIVSHAMN